MKPSTRAPWPPTTLTLLTIAVAMTGCDNIEYDAQRDAAALPDKDSTTTVADTRDSGTHSGTFKQFAEASIEARSDSAVTGGIAFDELDGLLRIHGSLSGLEPGAHGFHIHETGDCSAPDAASAGGHFAPMSSRHGAPSQPLAQRHAGDLGNIVASEDGTAAIDILVSASNSDDLGQRIIGKAVVVHGAADDLTSQPSGAAGDRVGCGVIQSVS